ncbi:MAG: type I-B CRISPR-associated protein Cas8b1/Cst1 [Caldilineaceae bacterium]|nr:type I-B CRISPR-associated protein Cas8b1/Cst1 [Caldilineaceae bacterium]
MQDYVGHLFYDVGAATIAAFVGKQHPTELTDEDLELVVDFVKREYIRQPLQSFLTVAFPNSGFTQPAYFNQPDKQKTYAQRVLQSYTVDTPKSEELCVFTGQPAAAVAFDVNDKLPPGRAYRQHVPLITGEGTINFFPYGDVGLPISGEALLAIQVLPLGCAKVGPRLLAVHSDNPEILYYFASTFLEQNRRQIQLAQASNSSRLPELSLKHRTLMIETLLKTGIMQREAREDERPFSVTAYHLSNSGQGPALDIYELPMQVIGFLREMETPPFKDIWHAIVSRAWNRSSDSRITSGKAKKSEASYNLLYEDLFQLPERADRFIRLYFLRSAWRDLANNAGPRGENALGQDLRLVSWEIAARFLRRILDMDSERIQQIREMGSALATYVSQQHDRRFFRQFYSVRRYDQLRILLIKASQAHVRQGNAPLIRLEPFIQVFEDGDELARVDWQLARDLVLIRMIEQLYELGWFKRHPEVIDDLDDTDESDNEH